MALRVGMNQNSEEEDVVSRSNKGRTQFMMFVVVTLVLAALFFLQAVSVVEYQGSKNAQVIHVRTKVIERNDEADASCQSLCSARTKGRHVKFQGDLLNRQDLTTMVYNARTKLYEKLRKDYGDYFDAIFFGDDKKFTPISSHGSSAERLKRKLMIKVLEVQTNIMTQEQRVAEKCDCSQGGKALVQSISPMGTEVVEVPDTYARYVWASGGHSSAAGHGNLFNESYTAVMGRDARLVFQSIGIDFEDRNYAMGGTASAAEIAMCWEQIFGSDVDFVSWDYGMTDGVYAQRLMYFGYRAALSPGRPALIGVKVGGRPRKKREGVLLELEKLGLPVFYGSDESHERRAEQIPDTYGMSKQEIDQLPEYVRNFRCGNQYEKGDPFCGSEKYTKYVCHPRGKQVRWHPGFKSHALDGHALGLFVVDALVEAVVELSKHEEKDPIALLKQLQIQEDELHQSFRDAILPEVATSIYLPGKNRPTDPELDVNALWKGPSLCRTGRLPAQSRFLGITTNSSKVGNIAILGKEQYDTGISVKEVDGKRTPGKLPLTYDPNTKDREACEVILKPDYKDFFYARNEYGVSKIVIPNEKEREAYCYDSTSHYKGLIMVVFVACDWGKCAQLELRPDHYAEQKYRFTVNGKDVTEIIPVGFDAWALKGEEGLYWQASSSGSYEIGISISEAYAFLKLSSFILY